ncbi:MAG: Na(+)-translocating NADH-quinone reductase subunit C [Myxococcales bacterium]|nr:Na(+)-translocating NADH-quinone reductase subunit C [Myxococcales bacterium]
MQYSQKYIVGFAAAVCLVCGIFVASAAVALRDQQQQNAVLDQQEKVLNVAGLLQEGQKVSPAAIQKLFDDNIKARIIDLQSGEYTEDDPASFDQLAATADPATSKVAPPNPAGVPRLPKKAKIYQVMNGENVSAVILPVHGKGLWSTMYGYVALAPDGNTIKGLTFYQHGETPGLGGEVDNPRWKGLWPGRKVYVDGEPKIDVIKGQAGPPAVDPYKVDGLSGATITSRGVGFLMRFWLGENGFGPYIQKFKSEGRAS